MHVCARVCACVCHVTGRTIGQSMEQTQVWIKLTWGDVRLHWAEPSTVAVILDESSAPLRLSREVRVCEEYNHSPLDTLKTQPDVTSLNHRETCVYTCVGFWECVRECRSTSFCQVSLGETDCAHSWGKLGQVCVCACMYILMCPPSFLSLLCLLLSLGSSTELESHDSPGWSPQWVNANSYHNQSFMIMVLSQSYTTPHP